MAGFREEIGHFFVVFFRMRTEWRRRSNAPDDVQGAIQFVRCSGFPRPSAARGTADGIFEITADVPALL
jgi:hypothetical protein